MARLQIRLLARRSQSIIYTLAYCLCVLCAGSLSFGQSTVKKPYFLNFQEDVVRQMAIDTLESYTYVRELRPNDHPMIKRFNQRFKVDDKAFWCATFYSYGWAVFGVKVYDITLTPSQVAGWRNAKTKRLVWSKYWSGNNRIAINPRPMDAVIMTYSHIEAYKSGNLTDKVIITIGGNTTGGNKGKKQGVYIAKRSLNGREVAYIYNHFSDYYQSIKTQWSKQMSF